MENIGKSIIKSSRFMSLATSHVNDTWIAPLFFCVDKNYNFYYVSSVHSKHISHISKNNNVAISIYNSEQEEGNANGIQIKGTGSKVPIEKYFEIIPLFCRKMGIEPTANVINNKIEEYNKNERAIYRVKPSEYYIQDSEYFKKHKIDRRIRINIT